MKYPNTQFSTAVSAVTGAQGNLIVPHTATMYAWLPSTWPATPTSVDAPFIAALKTIFDGSILSEIKNVVADAQARNGDLEHRGHVVAIALMCALDAISAYGYRGVAGWDNGVHIENFIKNHFPPDYQLHAAAIRALYRNCLIHSWNLFEVTLRPGNESIQLNGTLSFGLLNFLSALETATSDFLTKLASDPTLQRTTLERYQALRATAK
jgi:hypothetical protein